MEEHALNVSGGEPQDRSNNIVPEVSERGSVITWWQQYSQSVG